MKKVAILLLSALLAYLGGCAEAPIKPPTTVLPPPPSTTPGEKPMTMVVPEEARGDHLAAARSYSQLAAESTEPNSYYYRLRMAENLLLGGYLQPAQEALQEMPVALMQPQQLLSRRLLLARIAIEQRKPREVVAALAEAPASDSDSQLLRQYYQLNASAMQMLGNQLEFARNRIRLEPLLDEPTQRAENHQAIWLALSQMNAELLKQLRNAPPPDAVSGWLELVEISKSYLDKPEQMRSQLERWASSYPQHPAQADLYQELLNRKVTQPIASRQVAYLLPLTGNFSNAGKAIREGAMAAYYQSRQEGREVRLRFYDTAENSNITALYDQAVADGASVVLGPLRKNLVNQLVNSASFPVPTITLNYADRNPNDDNLFQLSLLPEDEARQVADRIWQDGYQSVAVISPQGTWGDRLLAAFTPQWRTHNNIHDEVFRYDPKQQGIADGIKNILGINGSVERNNGLRHLLGRGIKFSERRRKDIDAIFVAGVSSGDAAQIRPQLRYYGADEVPVYATSHIYTSDINARMLRDMDGILFCDMPWMLNSQTKSYPTRNALQASFAIQQSQDIRLYALGVDSLSMLPALRSLQRSPTERFEGVTGYLSVDKQRHILRQLEWAYFDRSGAIPVNERVIAEVQ